MDKNSGKNRKGHIKKFDPKHVVTKGTDVIIHQTNQCKQAHVQTDPGKRKISPVPNFLDVHVHVKESHVQGDRHGNQRKSLNEFHTLELINKSSEFEINIQRSIRMGAFVYSTDSTTKKSNKMVFIRLPHSPFPIL